MLQRSHVPFAGLVNRELQRTEWLTDGSVALSDEQRAVLAGGMDEDDHRVGGRGGGGRGRAGRIGWDQFEANKRMFNVQSTYRGACALCCQLLPPVFLLACCWSYANTDVSPDVALQRTSTPRRWISRT